MLTNEELCKYECILTEKRVKYFGLLSLGKERKCLFEDIKLLNQYLTILKNTEDCCCKLKGSYTALDNEYYFEDNIVYINGESFNYIYDCSSLFIEFTFERLFGKFTEFDILNDFQPNQPIYVQQGILIVDPLIYDNSDGFNTLEEFIEDFNVNNTGGVFLFLTEGNTLDLYAPYNGDTYTYILGNNDSTYLAPTTVQEFNEFIEFPNLVFDKDCNFTVDNSYYLDIEKITFTTLNPCTKNECLEDIDIEKIKQHIKQICNK